MSRAWMPFYVGDYLRDTMHLTPMQHGMYILLMLHYWEHGSLPDTSSGRARVARSPESTFRDHEPTLAAFFQQPGWHHKRIDRELRKAEIVSVKRKIMGAKGGFHSSMARVKNGKQLLGCDITNVTSNSLHSHKERKKEATEKESGKRRRDVASAELAAIYANKNGKGQP